MAITTSAELITAIGNWTGRDDLATRAVEFIVLAEAAFNRGFSESDPFRAFAQEANTTVSCSEYTTVPTDFLELRGIKGTWSGARQKLEYATPEVIDLMYPSSGTTGYPKMYTMEAGAIRVGPAPSSSLSIKILYYQKISALASGSNWLIANHPDIYLFGTLLHSGIYGRDDPELGRVIAGYNNAINGLRNSDRRVRFGGGALQIMAA